MNEYTGPATLFILYINKKGENNSGYINNIIINVIMHRRSEVLNRGGGVGEVGCARFRILGAKVGGGQLFAGRKLIGSPAPNQCQIITFLTLKN